MTMSVKCLGHARRDKLEGYGNWSIKQTNLWKSPLIDSYELLGWPLFYFPSCVVFFLSFPL